MAASDFAGYLFRTGTLQTTGTAFPNQYIEMDSYDSTPNQREEIKAERDDNTRDLIRVTAQGKKSVFHFKTRDNLTLSQKAQIQSFFTGAETNSDQRKVPLVYWNDEDNTYKEGTFYRPDIKFSIKRIEKKANGSFDIIYNAMEFDLIEY